MDWLTRDTKLTKAKHKDAIIMISYSLTSVLHFILLISLKLWMPPSMTGKASPQKMMAATKQQVLN
jgi:hypothetical protein